MPLLDNAIPGVPSFEREKKKAQRMSQEDFANAPEWARNWTPEEMEGYVNANVTDLASARQVISKLAWMCGALRDYMLLKQEANS